MPRVSEKLRCDKCNKLCKTAYGLTQHKKNCTGVKKEFKICEYCKLFIKRKTYKGHVISCGAKQFYNEYINFFIFLFKLIILYNNQNEKDNILRFNNEKKYYIFQKKTEEIEDINEIKKEEDKFKNDNDYIMNNIHILNDFFKEKKLEKENLLNELGLEVNKRNIKLIKLIDTVRDSQNINLSFRQIIFDFVNIKINNIKIKRKIIKRLNKKFCKKDFFTNEEIKNINEELSSKVLYLMHTNSLYFQKYNYYYNILKEYEEGNKNKYLCIFCNKYYFHKWAHYRRCFYLKKSFENSVSETFYKFINNNFSKEQLNKVVPEQVIKKYIERDFYFFISHIRENIINCGEYESSYNFYNFSYKINKIKIKNNELEKFLYNIYKEFEDELNPFLKRKIREYTIDYYLKNKKYNKKEIKKYILNEIKQEKTEKENEEIIKKIAQDNDILILCNSSFQMEEEKDLNEIEKNFKKEYNKLFNKKINNINNKKEILNDEEEDTLLGLNLENKDEKSINEEEIEKENLLNDDNSEKSLSYLNNII